MPLAPLLAFGMMSAVMTLTVVVALTVSLRWSDVAGLAALLVQSAGAWLLSNGGVFEGRILLEVRPGNGLVASDLFVLAPLGVAAWLVVRQVELQRGAPGGESGESGMGQ